MTRTREARQVLAVAARSPWFGQHAGYEQILKHVEDVADVAWIPQEPRLAPPVRAALWAAGRALRLDTAWGHAELLTIGAVLRRRPRVVHFLYADSLSSVTTGLLTRLGVRLMGTVHAPPERLEALVRDRGYASRLRQFTLVTAIARPQLDLLATVVPRTRIELVPHGVDTGFFVPDGGAGRAPGRHRIVSVGQSWRDLDLLVAVTHAVAARRPDVRFDVLTSPALSAGRAWPANVRLLRDGELSDDGLRRLYQGADASLTLLTRSSAQNAIVESLACGVPVIASDLPAVRDYVDPGVGWLVPRDVEAVVQAIEEATGDDRAAERRCAARRRAEAIDWARLAPRLREAYARVLA